MQSHYHLILGTPPDGFEDEVFQRSSVFSVNYYRDNGKSAPFIFGVLGVIMFLFEGLVESLFPFLFVLNPSLFWMKLISSSSSYISESLDIFLIIVRIFRELYLDDEFLESFLLLILLHLLETSLTQDASSLDVSLCVFSSFPFDTMSDLIDSRLFPR